MNETINRRFTTHPYDASLIRASRDTFIHSNPVWNQIINMSLWSDLLDATLLLEVVLQCATVCGSVLQCAAVCCSVLQHVATCCTVLKCIAICCNISNSSHLLGATLLLQVFSHVLRGVAGCCSALQCVAVCCSVLQCAPT